MTRATGMSQTAVVRIWRAFGLKPHLDEAWKLSTDPQFIERVRFTPEIRRWLLRHPRFHLHFTPTYSSWLNLVERWFAELTSKWLRRGTHRSVAEVTASIQAVCRSPPTAPS
jgi:hypothetical protein